MPKGFTEREKEIIKHKLLEKGKEFLNLYGIKKTNVEDLTKAAGISKGAFYLFYNSKEELFFEIFENFEKEVREKLTTDVFKPGIPARESFKAFFRSTLSEMEANPVFRNFNKEEFEYLVRKLPEERILGHMERDENYILQLLNEKKEYLSGDYDPKVVSGVFKSVFFMVLHKDDLGEDIYPGVIEMLLDMMAEYLIRE